MLRRQVTEESPIRQLEQQIQGGLGSGNLGVVMARAGVGKTACLVEIGLDALMRDRPVLHVALGQTVEHVQSWYDALFAELADRTALEDRAAVHALTTRLRMIFSFADLELTEERISKTIEQLQQHAEFTPQTVLIDGYDWAAHDDQTVRKLLKTVRGYASSYNAEVWVTVQTHREDLKPEDPAALPPPVRDWADLVDVALSLDPDGDDVTVRVVKAAGSEAAGETEMQLHGGALRRRIPQQAREASPSTRTRDFTLLSGGAIGAEAEFGACAERWGLKERTFTFSGRECERKRGLVYLGEEDLAKGAVSQVYLQAKMHRTYPDTPEFRKTLQTIWHQVNTAGEVFVVGEILPDKTVKGGTGWAAELGRQQKKKVTVFDQKRGAWFTWRGAEWVERPNPTIRAARFAGGGTRRINDSGRRAIAELFERSFGPAPGR